MTIPVGLLYALVPVLAAGLLSFGAWLVVQVGRQGAALARVAEQRDDHESRLKRLEAWYDGIAVGRRLERAGDGGSASP